MSAKHVAQWGNSLAVRITKEEAEALGWERDTPVNPAHTGRGEYKIRA